MDTNWNTTCSDSKQLVQISRGEKERLVKCSYQIQDLIPECIPEAELVIQRLELEYETMPLSEFRSAVQHIMHQLRKVRNLHNCHRKDSKKKRTNRSDGSFQI